MTAITTVLCPVDFSRESERELELAAAICRRFGARLVLEHNLEPRPPSYLGMTWMWSEEHEEGERDRGAEAEKRLRRELSRLSQELPCEAKLTRGPLDAAVLTLARGLPADLLVMASHGPSTSDHRSLTEQVLENAPCPVLTVGERAEEGALSRLGPQRAGELTVLVAVAGDDGDGAVLAYAAGLTERLPIRLALLRLERRPPAPGGPAADAEPEELPPDLPESLRSGATAWVGFGDPAKAVLSIARRVAADLILLGTHRRRLLERRSHGLDAEVLHGSHCPVWYVPAVGGAE